MIFSKYFFAGTFLFLSNFLTAQNSVSLSQLISAEKMFDLDFTPAKRDSILSGAADNIRLYHYLHQNNLSNDVPLPLWFDPVLPGKHFNKQQHSINWDIPANTTLPQNKNELAFYSISQLASLIKTKKISSVELTKFFIERLKKYSSTLHCVIEIPEDIALRRAAKADADLAKGIYKSPLQGI